MAHDLEALKSSLVELGATKVAHLDGDLLTHMVNVYNNLNRFAQPEHVMLAGLFHGIYGTHALHSSDVFVLPEGKRERVREIIGADAERLLYNFCVMTYESLGKSLRRVLKPDGQPDLWDRCTGKRLDVNREDFNELLWVKLADLLAHVPQLSNETRAKVVGELGPFWRVVAEHLGPRAVAGWNSVLGDLMRIPTSSADIS